jgi:hypothetical protein
MRNFLALTLMGLILVAVLAACGSTKVTHCDAYGSLDEIDNNDLTSL